MSLWRTSLLAAALWSGAVVPAGAAEVHVEEYNCHAKIGCQARTSFTAAPGERNALVIEPPESGGGVILRDTGAPLTAGEGCTALDANAVRCTVTDVAADLGDGDDRASAHSGGVSGGTGNDDLTTSGGSLTGGPGEDILRSDARGGFFTDGDGTTPASDRYLGGEGADTLSYGTRSDGVNIDLRATGPAGKTGEGDHIEGIENAEGGDGDDVLTGNERPNRLSGGAGADRLLGLEGDDTLDTGAGRGDEVDGGPGSDAISSGASTFANVVRCGSGSDSVEATGLLDRIASDCERISLGFLVEDEARLRTTLANPGSALLTVRRCDCARGRFVVLAGGRSIGGARGTARRLALRLNADGRRLLVKRRRLLVSIQYRERDGKRTEVEGFRIELRLRR